MSEAALWLIYLSGTVPVFLLRHLHRIDLLACCAIAGEWSPVVRLTIAVSNGVDLVAKWSGVGLWIAFSFGAIAGPGGAGAAIWRE